MTDYLNQSVTYIVDYALHDPTYPPLVKMFIILGLMSAITVTMQTAGKGLTMFAYVVGAIKWLFKASREDIQEILRMLSFRQLRRKIGLFLSRWKSKHNPNNAKVDTR